MTITDWIQAISMLILVVVTVIYAWRTHVISKATREQADASIKMAKEMREQTVIASRPLVIQKCVHEKDIWEGSTKDYFSHFEISNVGNGPAIEIEVSLVDNEGNWSSSVRQTFLRTDDSPIKFNPYNMASLEEAITYYIVCEYQEVFWNGLQKLLYQTRLPFKISKSSERDKIYIIAGKLEFKKEVSEKDRIDAFSSRSKPK